MRNARGWTVAGITAVLLLAMIAGTLHYVEWQRSPITTPTPKPVKDATSTPTPEPPAVRAPDPLPTFEFDPAAAVAPASPFVAGLSDAQDTMLVAETTYGGSIPFQTGYQRWTWDRVNPGPGQYRWTEITDYLNRCGDAGITCGVSIVPSKDGGNCTMVGMPWHVMELGVDDPIQVNGKYYLNYLDADVNAAWLAMITAFGQEFDGNANLAYVTAAAGIEGEPNPWRHHYDPRNPSGTDPCGVDRTYQEEYSVTAWKSYVEDTIDQYDHEFANTDLFYFFSGYFKNVAIKKPLMEYAAARGIGGDMSGIRAWDNNGDSYGGVCNLCADDGPADWLIPLCLSDTVNFIGEFSFDMPNWNDYWSLANGLSKGYKIIRPVWTTITNDTDRQKLIDSGIYDLVDTYAEYAGQWNDPSNSPGVWCMLKPLAPQAGYCSYEGMYEFYLSYDWNVAGGHGVGIGVDLSDPRGWVAVRTNAVSGDNYLYFNIHDGWAYDDAYTVAVDVTYFDNGTDDFELQYDNGVGDEYASAGTKTKTNTNTWLTHQFTINSGVFGNNMTGDNDLRLYNSGDGDDTFHLVEVARVSGDAPATPTPGPTATRTVPPTFTPTFTGTPPTPTNTPTATDTPGPTNTPTPSVTPTNTTTPFTTGVPDEDTTIDRWNSTANYAWTSTNDLRWDSGDSDVESILIKFDVSDLPADSTALDAKLRMFVDWTNNSNAITATLYGISTTWEAQFASWDYRDTATAWDTAGAKGADADIASTQTAATQITESGIWYEWDVTSLVQSWIDGTDNNGLKLEATAGSATLFRLVSFQGLDTYQPELQHLLRAAHTYADADEHTQPGDSPWVITMTASLDDASDTAGSNYTDTAPYLNLGTDGDGDWTSGMRFQDVPIRPSTVIITAELHLAAAASYTNTVSWDVWAEDADDADAFSSGSKPSDRITTTAWTTWTPGTWVTDTYYTVSVSSALQELVDRGGWVSGTNSVFLTYPTAGETEKRQARSYDYDSASLPPILKFGWADYTPTPTNTHTPTRTPTPTITPTGSPIPWTGALIEDQVSQGSDDAYNYFISYYESEVYVQWGFLSTTGFRFEGIGIPGDCDVISSTLHLRAGQDAITPITVTIHAQDTGPSQNTFSAGDEPEDRTTLTTATVQLGVDEIGFVEDEWWDSPDLSSIVTELLNTHGAMQDITIIVVNDGTVSGLWDQISTYEEDPSYAAKFSVNCGSAFPSTATPTVTSTPTETPTATPTAASGLKLNEVLTYPLVDQNGDGYVTWRDGAVELYSGAEAVSVSWHRLILEEPAGNVTYTLPYNAGTIAVGDFLALYSSETGFEFPYTDTITVTLQQPFEWDEAAAEYTYTQLDQVVIATPPAQGQSYARDGDGWGSWAWTALTTLGTSNKSATPTPTWTAVPGPGGTSTPTYTVTPTFTPTSTLTPTPTETFAPTATP